MKPFIFTVVNCIIIYPHILYIIFTCKGIQTSEIEKNIPLDQQLSLNCTTDLALTSMEWLDSEGTVLANTSEQQLIWEISKITDAHHNTKYICQVVGPFGDQNKSVTLLVAQPVARSSNVGGVVAAVLFILLLLVAGILLTAILVAKRYSVATW